MSPTDEQVDQAIAAFDENWRKRPDITVKNFAAARRDAVRAALEAVTSQKERPLQAAARRWDLVILPEGTAQGEEILCLSSDGASNTPLSPVQSPSWHEPVATMISLKSTTDAPNAALRALSQAQG
jgi:hypothetical protein